MFIKISKFLDIYNHGNMKSNLRKLILETKLALNNLENEQKSKETLLKLMEYALTSQKLNSMTKTPKIARNDPKE